MARWSFGKVILVCVLGVAGCMNNRFSVVPRVRDVGTSIRTNNRYTLTGFYVGDTRKSVEGNGYQAMKFELERSFPDVFGDGGIPFVLRDNGFRDYHTDYGWTALIYIFSLTTLPMIQRHEQTGFFVVEFPHRQETFNLEIRKIWDESMTCYTPFAWLALNDPLEVEGHRSFSTIRSTTLLDQEKIARNWHFPKGGLSEVERKAVAYGVVQQLHELETAGHVPKDVPDGSRPYQSYRVVSLRRETGKDFAYQFALELDANIANPIQALRAIQQDFRKALQEDYIETSPGTVARSLVVDFKDFRLADRRVDGRAVVLTIEVNSLTYDPNTRRGCLSVRFGPNQYEEARQWIRRNIETLVRDKNVALVAGVIPQAARFYLGSEQVREQRILEIEFKTE